MAPFSRYTRRALALLALTLPLYALPARAQTPGELVSAQRFHADWLPHQAARVYKVSYGTSDLHRRPALSTGLVFLPAGAAPPGGWPVVSWAHGTQGIADRCAPSVSGPFQPARDAAYLGQFLQQGYAVVASDFQGLGSPGEHAYLHGPSVARNIVDMVSASQQLSAALPARQRLSARWVSVGHSQGAGAAIHAASVATALGGPSLDFRGAVGTGTPAWVNLTTRGLGPDATGQLGAAVNAYMSYLITGLIQADPRIDGLLTDVGRQRLAMARQLCLADLTRELEGATLAEYFHTPLSTLPGIGAVLDDYLGMPLRGFDQPFLLAHGMRDTDVSYHGTLLYGLVLALHRQPVRFRSYRATHAETLQAASADALAFVNARFADVPAASLPGWNVSAADIRAASDGIDALPDDALR